MRAHPFAVGTLKSRRKGPAERDERKAFPRDAGIVLLLLTMLVASVLGVRALGHQPGTEAPGGRARSATGPAGVSEGRPAAPPSPSPTSPTRRRGLVTEANDNGYFIVIDQAGNEVGAGSAIQLSKDVVDDVHVEISAGLAPGGVLMATVDMRNDSPDALEFPEGVRMVVTITRDGSPWRTVEIADATVTKLPPGGTFTGRATVSGAEGPAELVFAVSIDTWRP